MPSSSDQREQSVPAEPEITYHAPINEWQEADRPREKLIQRGPGVLSEAELIALIIGSGTRTKDGPVSAVQLGKALGRAYGTLYKLSQRPIKELTRTSGIGTAKAAKLVAAFEIGRRVESQRGGTRVQVCSPEDVAAVYGPLMRDLKKEVFKVVLLNTANVVTGDYTVSEGGLASSIVEPRAVFQRAILDSAAAVICLHNHPSGQSGAQQRGHPHYAATGRGRAAHGHTGTRSPDHRGHRIHFARRAELDGDLVHPISLARQDGCSSPHASQRPP